MTFKTFIGLMVGFTIFTKLYNFYCETCYHAFPTLRTQTKNFLSSEDKDICGRTNEQMAEMKFHDRLTFVSQMLLNVGIYFLVPGFYPSFKGQGAPIHERAISLLLNHYVMSFGMYWMHRACHVHPFLWEKIHSLHHYAGHPLARATYMDHWFDNFANAFLGHFMAQLIVPLDGPTFVISRIFRIAESLEKHSGISGWPNLAHILQRKLPFAQMPHHHDWHHEGFKTSNYTFSSIGGLWDCVFGTRMPGRAPSTASTMNDEGQRGKPRSAACKGKGFMDQASLVMLPLLVLPALVLARIQLEIAGPVANTVLYFCIAPFIVVPLMSLWGLSIQKKEA
eukprot:CAMPEP_0113941014 /NCGR_PEP_ID=MMETSP1339-20121228/7028_1 /TAXON_ID=94617 /ORGANISM="Fibrocapsa japonica" /LENGTH=336 /DNA_ID=CAMNT_0000945037 /DNA_START=1 /DNA_END=1011 /DNA_ORIENTATION=+ /assembly_acc=CAM_ASM_000762